MRCSAYEGCQWHGASELSFLNSFPCFPFPVFPSPFSFARRAPFPLGVPGRVPVTSSYSSIASTGEPMMSCLTLETAVGGTRPI